MSERVVQYIDRAMVGRRIEIGVYADEKVAFSAFGRLQTVEVDKQTEQTRVYFVGDTDTSTVRIPFGYEFLITWDPEERD